MRIVTLEAAQATWSTLMDTLAPGATVIIPCQGHSRRQRLLPEPGWREAAMGRIALRSYTSGVPDAPGPLGTDLELLPCHL